jgi:phosphoribosylglycinamide formyltransferase-1
MVNIVVLVSGSGSNLQAIIDQVSSGELPVRISLVVSNNADAYALQRAKSANIDACCIDHRSFSSRLEFDQALIDKIDQVKPDLLVLAGFMRILTAEFVAHYHNRLINIHPSLLPKYPGTDTHQRAIDANDEWHGVSIHFVVPEVDAGPVIVQGRFGIRANDTPESLQQRIHRIEHKLYPLAVKWYAQGRLTISAGKVLLDGETASDQLQSFDL